MLHSNVQDKCRRISVCLSKLDNRLVATNLNHMLWADMVREKDRGKELFQQGNVGAVGCWVFVPLGCKEAPPCGR